MDTDIKISIILPAFNVEKTLTRSIKSVLQQTYKNFELIIINDCSSDKTDDIIRSFNDSRIVYIKNNTNLGLIKNLNNGISIAKGEYIARIDGDDIWITEDKLEKQIDFLESNKDYVLVGTQAFFKKGQILKKSNYPINDISIRKKILRKNPFIHSTVVFRKEVLEKDPYKVENYLLEDYALWLKLGLIGKFINLDEYTTEYLINPDGETQTKNLRQTINSFKTIKNYKKQYPNYFQSYIFWILKIILRKLLLNLK